MNVICPQCGKDYNIDENRIPPSGITIKCPKCMHSFKIEKPSEQPAEPAPAAPDIPDMPDIPDIPDMPDIPDIPDMPDIPDIPDTPDMPDMPDIPDVPDSRSSPQESAAPADAGLPDIPDVPGEPEEGVGNALDDLFSDTDITGNSVEDEPAPLERQSTRVASMDYDTSATAGDLPDTGDMNVPKDFELVDSEFGASLGAGSEAAKAAVVPRAFQF